MRKSLVLNLVVECLYALRENRPPKVRYERVQQVIRSLDDEVRGDAANIISRFVREVSGPGNSEEETPSPEDLFRSAAKPFLGQVWPQERSLATPGVSEAFADLPATARGAFAEAVDAIERFLVPFSCWSLAEYGLFGDDNESEKLSIIDDRRKAEAFLTLLDRTIGRAEGAVIPYDLGRALDHIAGTEKALIRDLGFQRLATLARRL